MPRYRLTLEYDGTGFNGWQKQENAVSIQAALEEAARRFCGDSVEAVAAGRTDAGVHARGQVVHLDLARDWTTDAVRDAINFHLKPAPVAVLSAVVAPPDFHARFSAVGRAYLYRILDRRAPPALDRHQVWHVPVPLDADAMHAAAQHLVGHHDFTSFRSTQCQAKSPVKTIDQLTVARMGEEIHVWARARSFLHNQVRIIVGTLKLVGDDKWAAADVARALAAHDRTAAGPTAPPQGLCLMEVRY